MLKIENDLFKIYFDEKSETVFFNGTIRLWDPSQYEEIKNFLIDIYDLKITKYQIDLTNLDFLNSSGISMLCKFIFEAKKINKCPLIFIGSEKILWQKKSLANLKKIWDTIELQLK